MSRMSVPSLHFPFYVWEYFEYLLFFLHQFMPIECSDSTAGNLSALRSGERQDHRRSCTVFMHRISSLLHFIHRESDGQCNTFRKLFRPSSLSRCLVHLSGVFTLRTLTSIWRYTAICITRDCNIHTNLYCIPSILVQTSIRFFRTGEGIEYGSGRRTDTEISPFTSTSLQRIARAMWCIAHRSRESRRPPMHGRDVKLWWRWEKTKMKIKPDGCQDCLQPKTSYALGLSNRFEAVWQCGIH